MKYSLLRERGKKTGAIEVVGEIDQTLYPPNKYTVLRTWTGESNVRNLDHIQPTEYIKSVLAGKKVDNNTKVQEVGEFDDVNYEN